MKYFNIKTNHGVETVDSLNPKDFKTYFAFRLEIKRILKEYHLCNMNVYVSQRCCKGY